MVWFIAGFIVLCAFCDTPKATTTSLFETHVHAAAPDTTFFMGTVIHSKVKD